MLAMIDGADVSFGAGVLLWVAIGALLGFYNPRNWREFGLALRALRAALHRRWCRFSFIVQPINARDAAARKALRWN